MGSFPLLFTQSFVVVILCDYRIIQVLCSNVQNQFSRIAEAEELKAAPRVTSPS